jgi:ribosomal-protein-serine acetyltransferase
MRLIQVDDRTLLRSVSETDAPGLFALVDENRAHLRRWLPWLDANRSIRDTLEFIRASMAGEQQGRSFIGLIDHEGELCGTAGLNWIDHDNRACEIGYWLRADRQGRGIVTLCCCALIRHAFLTLGLNRVNIPVAVGNARSRAIPERLGFHQDGILRDGEWLYDHFHDVVLFTLLRREFLAREETFRPPPGSARRTS